MPVEPALGGQLLLHNHDQLYFRKGFGYINAPDGFLINGKISVTNSSNSNTVAIKTMGGNDPSASEPVYVRIGDAIRTISAALSVSTVAGQGHFNEVNAGIVDKDTDYFVYLFWKAADSTVVISVSRIPYGRVYSDFSGSNGNEKYLLYSAQPAATDSGVVIGRINMTCASTTNYWSIPATPIVIQRPIYETRWLSYTPAFASGAAFTNAPTAGTPTGYRLSGEWCQVRSFFTTNATSGGLNYITTTLPFSIKNSSTNSGYGAQVTTGYTLLVQSNVAANKYTIYKYDASTPIANSTSFDVNGQFNI